MIERSSQSRGWLRTIWRWCKRLVFWSGLALLLATCFGLVAGWYSYQQYVVEEPGSHIESSHIQSIIAQDSPVYYRDRQTRVGVFFGDEHRHYVGFEDIPLSFRVAIVAAEDGAYWSHSGVNLMGISRAMWSNIKARRLVAGGSTITQQTAKNLYYRPDRSLKSKWTELVNALRLEAHYSKEDILTFYSNQFHVHGNGRGIGIAARYFFDKDLTDSTDSWSLLESAYVAGLVKGPSLYDPFMGSAERQEKSKDRAIQRTRYVLRRIVDEPFENLVGPITNGDRQEQEAQIGAMKEEARALLDEGFELPFKKGVFRYESSAVLDEVKRRLSEPPFDQVLAKAGIEDPRRAGLVVVTTLDPLIQRESTYGLWHHLSDVGAVLEDAKINDFVLPNSRGPRFEPNRGALKHEFRIATVKTKQLEKWPYSAALDLGGTTCQVDHIGLERLTSMLKKAKLKRRRTTVKRSEIKGAANRLNIGDVVWVSIREVSDGGVNYCDLERRPELQGATIVLEKGEVRAMVGGNDNRNFNRSTALRQMGSTWKPLVFHAALELGWSPDDLLDNSRNVFPFSTTYYYPRPDHTPHPKVSLSWSGVNSENLASIWLLYHLMDRLDGEEIRVLATNLDLARRPDEGLKAYRTRIQKAGVLPTRARVKEQNFLRARQDVLSGLDEVENQDERLALLSMVYGWGYGGERERISLAGGKDMGWKLQALENAWLPMSKWLRVCETQYSALKASVDNGQLPPALAVSDLGVWQDGLNFEVSCGALPSGYVPISEESIGPLIKVDEPEQDAVKKGKLHKLKSWLGFGQKEDVEESAPERPALVGLDEVFVQDRLHFRTLRAVQSALSRIELVQGAAEATPDLYDEELLYWHQDFRVLLAMRYVTEMAKQYGVRSEIPPVMSMPLGAAEITLEEAASVYGGLITGQGWSFPGIIPNPVGWTDTNVDAPPAPTLLISEVLDVDGNVIYYAKPQATEVANPLTADMTSDILRNVVQHGTGKRAANAVIVEQRPVPVGGKTGTTNEYRNAVFMGFVPKAVDGGFSSADGFVVGTYVGYDDNRPMTRGSVRIAGSSGALPAWIGAARGLSEFDFLGEPPNDQWTEGQPKTWPSKWSPQLEPVSVHSEWGTPLGDEDPDQNARVLVKRPDQRADLVFEMLFEQSQHPIRMSPRTDQIRTEDAEDIDNPPSIWEP